MAISGIPKTEKVWLTCHVSDDEIYYITAKIKDRSTYFLYKRQNGVTEKVAKNASPTALHDKYVEPRYTAARKAAAS